MKAKDLREYADQTFGKRGSLLSLWQEQAENFYPERADFTLRRHLGDEFAANLSTSFPLLCRRELAGAFPTMLRPSNLEWFEMVLKHGDKPDHEGKAWLQWARGVQRRAMYDLASQYARAVVEADNDYAAFGQDVQSVRLNQIGDGLLYRCWHLRDVSWLENDDGIVDTVFRRAKWQARYMDKKWGTRNAPGLKKIINKNPFTDVDGLHMIVPMDTYTGDLTTGKQHDGERRKQFPYVSLYYDCMHNHLLEAVPTHNREYIIERWQTVSGSQYSYSPATVAALPDARLLQAMTYTLLEAGEKATNPPMVATEGAVRSDVAVYAGGITWVDFDYDERLGEALRPMSIDKSGLPIGVDMQRDSRALLKACFFIDKLKPFVPTQDPQMTAYQAGQIVAQYIRDALPIFEPMEVERNGQTCEMTFDILLRNGAFGSPAEMPRSLQGKEIDFQFQSPLHDAIEAQKGQKFLEMAQMLQAAAAMDKNAAAIPNVIEAFRDALDGIHVPRRWTRSETEVKEMEAAAAMQQQTEAMLAQFQQGADAAKTTGEAINQLSQAQPEAA